MKPNMMMMINNNNTIITLVIRCRVCNDFTEIKNGERNLQGWVNVPIFTVHGTHVTVSITQINTASHQM